MGDQSDWVMPEWMEQYSRIIGGDKAYIEEMMNDNTIVQVNAARVLMVVHVKGKIEMMNTLHKHGLLWDVSIGNS